jgi:hypothetical protein
MKLTGKCREDFEKYFILNLYQDRIQHTAFSHRYDILEAFYTQPQSMQYGVYVDFFDSVGINIEITNDNKDIKTFWVDINAKETDDVELNSRPEARTAAVEKANELRNAQLNK